MYGQYVTLEIDGIVCTVWVSGTPKMTEGEWKHRAKEQIRAKFRESDRLRTRAEWRAANPWQKDDDTITDDFNPPVSAWCPNCHKKTMQVVRPGSYQCSHCG